MFTDDAQRAFFAELFVYSPSCLLCRAKSRHLSNCLGDLIRSLPVRSTSGLPVYVAASLTAPFSTSLGMTKCALRRLVFKVPLALERIRIFVLAQNIFVEVHLGTKEVLEPSFDPLSILQHFLRDVISVNVDANRADDSEFLSFDRNRRAFEFSRADVQLVVQLVLVEELAAFQIYQQICCTVA